jgi:hypothetical protein
MEETTKYLYLIHWWPPFPATEYGGLIVLIASNDKECKDMLEQRFPKETSQYKHAFAAAFMDYKRFELGGDKQELIQSEIIEEFIT